MKRALLVGVVIQIFVGYLSVVYAAPNLSKKMLDMANVFAIKMNTGVSSGEVVSIHQIKVVDIGKDKGNGLPVKFYVKGSRNTPHNSYSIDSTTVYYFTKDEFNKHVICSTGNMFCMNESDIEEYKKSNKK